MNVCFGSYLTPPQHTHTLSLSSAPVSHPDSTSSSSGFLTPSLISHSLHTFCLSSPPHPPPPPHSWYSTDL